VFATITGMLLFILPCLRAELRYIGNNYDKYKHVYSPIHVFCAGLVGAYSISMLLYTLKTAFRR